MSPTRLDAWFFRLKVANPWRTTAYGPGGTLCNLDDLETNMFLNMNPVRSEKFSANGNEYELLLFRIEETKDYRLFVSKGGFGAGPSFTAKDEVINDAKLHNDLNIEDVLVNQAKNDITRDEFSEY